MIFRHHGGGVEKYMPENTELELRKEYTKINKLEKIFVAITAIGLLASIYTGLHSTLFYKAATAVLRVFALVLVVMTFLTVKCPHCRKYPGGGLRRKSCNKCGCQFS